MSGENKIRNMGTVSMERLRRIGIGSTEDLARVGSVDAFLRLKAQEPGISIIMLHAMEAALWDLRWNELPAEIKADLHERVGYRPQKKQG